MFRIRFHGRGGQGMKRASRILGTAFFLEGFEVQDAPLYGAERRGAPVFAYLRADHSVINERGLITRPDLVAVADDTLVPVPAAGVLKGLTKDTILLIKSEIDARVWKERLNVEGTLLTITGAYRDSEEEEAGEARFLGSICAGATAALTGVISRESLERAVSEEIGSLGEEAVEKSLKRALSAYDDFKGLSCSIKEGKAARAEGYARPDWIDFPFEEAALSAPAIHASATSERMKTGLWRTMRPDIDYDACNRCWWLCSTFCPDGAISVNEEGFPQIDYEHCKGCMVCVAQCPTHAISAVPESGVRGEKS